MAKLEVHHLNNSRSQRVLWLLEELEVPYEIVKYQRDAKTNLAPDSLKAIHPLGKSPVIRDDGQVVIESGAIIEYIVRKYGKGRLAPDPATPDGVQYLQLMHYAEGSAMLPVMLRLYLTRLGEAGKPLEPRVVSEIENHMGYLDSLLRAATGSSATRSRQPTSSSRSRSRRRVCSTGSRSSRTWRSSSTASTRVRRTSARSRRAARTRSGAESYAAQSSSRRPQAIRPVDAADIESLRLCSRCSDRNSTSVSQSSAERRISSGELASTGRIALKSFAPSTRTTARASRGPDQRYENVNVARSRRRRSSASSRRRTARS